MKWSLKGHEFDELGDRLISMQSIYLFGAGVHGKTVFEKYHEKIVFKGFIDNDAQKQAQLIYGLPILNPKEITLSEKEAVVITAQPSLVPEISRQLLDMGIADNVFSMHSFFPVLDYYKFSMLCLPSVSFLPTTVCTLKCKHCLNFTPHIKKHEVRPLEALKADLHLLFSKLDSLLLLHISGGEPFTYPELDELLLFIDSSFGNKLGRLEMTTNGTIIPTDSVFSALKEANVFLTVDDYRGAIPQNMDNHRELLTKLDDYKVNYQVLKADYWIDLAPFETDFSQYSEKQLISHFIQCAVPWQEYRDGKLYLCNYAAYAEIAGIVDKLPDHDFFDFNNVTRENRIELLEFRLGYSDKGYTEFCKGCAGYGNNPHTVIAAEQA